MKVLGIFMFLSTSSKSSSSSALIMPKTMRPFRIFLLLYFFSIHLSAQNKALTDHHVHIFSEELLMHLKSQRLLGNSFKEVDRYYTDIDTIVKNNNAQKLWLISSGYAYSTSQNLEEEINLQLAEHQHLHNAASKFTNKIEPFYGINPLKPYALQLIKRAHKHLAFKGIKLHFQSSQIEFRNQKHVLRLWEIFSYTSQHDIPVIIHFQNHKNAIRASEIDFFFNYILPKQYNHQLIFAHLGSSGWLKNADLKNASYLKAQADVNQNVEIMFDLSGIINSGLYNGDLATDDQISNLLKSIGHKQLLFGSDYPLYSSQKYLSLLRKTLPFKRKQWKRILKNTW